MTAAMTLARVVIDEIIRHGVRHIVGCPGSRNGPVMLAAAAAQRAGHLELHTRIDERSAGFLAIGLSRHAGPVAVLTTSGSAVANLHPAVLEANYSAARLVLLTADRPAHLRGTGANQTLDTQQLFGDSVAAFAEIDAHVGTDPTWRRQIRHVLRAGRQGPVQLNLALAEPLLGDGAWPDDVWTSSGPEPAADEPDDDRPIPGPGDGEKVLILTDLTAPVPAGQMPVISEAGGLAGKNILAHGMCILDMPSLPEQLRPDRIVVAGRPTLFRAVTELLGSGVPIDVLSGGGPIADPGGFLRFVGNRFVDTGCGATDYLAAWRAANAKAGAAIAQVLDGAPPDTGALVLRRLGAALPDSTRLLLASSQIPRDIGRFTLPRNGITVFANRGLAGIDGLISTAVGIGLGGPVTALLGDLAFGHDLGGLAIGRGNRRPQLRIVLLDNDGGGIFHTLEAGSPSFARDFERCYATAQTWDLLAAAHALGCQVRQVNNVDELVDLVQAPPREMEVVRMSTDRSHQRALDIHVRCAVAQAVCG